VARRTAQAAHRDGALARGGDRRVLVPTRSSTATRSRSTPPPSSAFSAPSRPPPARWGSSSTTPSASWRAFDLAPGAAWLLVAARVCAALFGWSSRSYLVVVASRREMVRRLVAAFRYALVGLPLLLLLLVPLLAPTPRRPASLRRAPCLTFALTSPGSSGGWTYSFATDAPSPRLRRSPRSTSDAFHRAWFGRTATWLAPLACLLLVPLVWRWPRRRAGHISARPGGARPLWRRVPRCRSASPTKVIELEDPGCEKRRSRPLTRG
jgi:hypothetical protein